MFVPLYLPNRVPIYDLLLTGLVVVRVASLLGVSYLPKLCCFHLGYRRGLPSVLPLPRRLCRCHDKWSTLTRLLKCQWLCRDGFRCMVVAYGGRGKIHTFPS